VATYAETKEEVAGVPAVRDAAPVAQAQPPMVAGKHSLMSQTTGEIIGLPDPTQGISECPITDKEAAILRARADPDAELDIKYDGAVYMPGACLRKRMLDAFGPGRWAMRQEAPIIYDCETSEIVVDYSLWVKGCYVSRAQAGWTWNPQNARMSKSDSIESAQTECLRRLCKNLGVGLELWMPGVAEKWKVTHAESYKNDKGKTCWRRKAGGKPQSAGAGSTGVGGGQIPPAPASAGPSSASAPAPERPVGDCGGQTCPKCGAKAVGPVVDKDGKPTVSVKSGKKIPVWTCSTARWSKAEGKSGCDWNHYDPHYSDDKPGPQPKRAEDSPQMAAGIVDKIGEYRVKLGLEEPVPWGAFLKANEVPFAEHQGAKALAALEKEALRREAAHGLGFDTPDVKCPVCRAEKIDIRDAVDKRDWHCNKCASDFRKVQG
jgi:hypothetical protein